MRTSSCLIVFTACFAALFFAPAKAAVTAPAIRSKAQWGGSAGSSGGSNRPTRAIIHHTAGAARHYNGDSTLRAIQNFHKNDNGWSDIGYHYIIGVTGVIYRGREDSVIGAHAAGVNTGSLGVCLIGDFSNGDQPTQAQKDSAIAVLAYIGDRYGFRHANTITGHRNSGSTTATNCPGDTLFPLLGELATAADNLIAAGTGGTSASASEGSEGSTPRTCTSPGTFDAALGTCSDGRNTGNCVANAAACPGGVTRSVTGCTGTCCFSAECGCNEDPSASGNRASPSTGQGECTSASGQAGVCIETGGSNPTTCPSGNIVSDRCPNDPDTVKCCLDREVDCRNAAATIGIPFLFLSAGGAMAYGVTRMYDPKKSKGSKSDSEKPLNVSRKRSGTGSMVGTMTSATNARPSQKRLSNASKGSKGSKGRTASTTSKGSKGRTASTTSKGSNGRRTSQTSDATRAKSKSRTSIGSRNSQKSNRSNRSNRSKNSKNSKSSKSSKSSKASKSKKSRTSKSSKGRH